MCSNTEKVYAPLKLLQRRLRAASDTLVVDGKRVTGEKCLEAWKAHFSSLLNRPPAAGEPLRPDTLPDYGIDVGLRTVAGASKATQQIKNGKAAGEEGIQPESLKTLPSSTVTALTTVYKSIWDTEAIPEKWRTVVAIPMHKKGATTNPANYRGTSMLCWTSSTSCWSASL